MDALGRLLRTMMWDNVQAEDCQEMFNVSTATAQTDFHIPSSVLQGDTPDSTSASSQGSSLTHLTHHIGPVLLKLCVGSEQPVTEEAEREQEPERENEWIWSVLRKRTFLLWPTASPNVACFTKRLGKRKSLPDHRKSTDKRYWGK